MEGREIWYPWWCAVLVFILPPLGRLQREKAWREKRARSKEEAVREKQTAYQSKESEKMEALRAMIAMAGGKITIAKRADA